MSALKAVLRKLVPGVFTAATAVAVASLSVSVVEGELFWFGLGAALRVGLPAFIAGVLFFPVNEKTVAGRIGFSLRAGLATAASALVHRVFWLANNRTDEPWSGGIDFSSVVDVILNPSWLVPPGPVDVTAWLAAAAIAGATATGFMVQPALKRFARGQRPSVASALAQLDASRGRARVMVRSR